MTNFEDGDYVLVNDLEGRYVAEVLSVGEFEDPEGKDLLGVQVLFLDDPPRFSISEGETCNVYPKDVKKLDDWSEELRSR